LGGLLVLIERNYLKADGVRKPYSLETMLHIHLLQASFPRLRPAITPCATKPVASYAAVAARQ
jgi:hypothetical protein